MWQWFINVKIYIYYHFVMLALMSGDIFWYFYQCSRRVRTFLNMQFWNILRCNAQTHNLSVVMRGRTCRKQLWMEQVPHVADVQRANLVKVNSRVSGEGTVECSYTLNICRRMQKSWGKLHWIACMFHILWVWPFIYLAEPQKTVKKNKVHREDGCHIGRIWVC